MPLITLAETRKERRKAERKKRKQRHGHHHHHQQEEEDDSLMMTSVMDTKKQSHSHTIDRSDVEDDAPAKKKMKKGKETSISKENNNKKESSRKDHKGKKNKASSSSSSKTLNNIDPSLAAAIQRDDEEIAELEAKLGIKKNKKGKEKLNKEYAKLEGYGDDFGDFLDDLDDMVRRVRESNGNNDYSDNDSDDNNNSNDDDDDDENDDDDASLEKGEDDVSDDDGSNIKLVYHNPNMDPDMIAAIQRDEDEIRELEEKLGLKNKKNKKKIFKEYSAEGYGDDFGDFLDGLDDMVARVSSSKNDAKYSKMLRDGAHGKDEEGWSDDNNNNESSDEEELVPMKEPFEEMDEDDSVLEELDREEADDDGDGSSSEDDDPQKEVEDDSGDDDDDASDKNSDQENESEQHDSQSDDDSQDDPEVVPDHDVADTYRPTKGEDIYGNKIDSGDSGEQKPTKYVPPHLRKSLTDDSDQQEKIRMIKRLLNNALNRLSEDTLISVAQQVAQVYSSHPTQMVHEVLWKNSMQACVTTPMVMTGLIPTYVACIVGAHIQTGDTVQIGEYMLEQVVVEMWKGLQELRKEQENRERENNTSDELQSKAVCNLMLILCYLYNFNIVHCSFMYDIIRHLIDGFAEVDIECLLLLLSHCGHSLRSDDPLALKEIVLLVQKKKSEDSIATSSRTEYMISAIMDLKNNKRRKQDDSYSEKTSKLKKSIGRIKSVAAKSGKAKTMSEASLRISLKDILEAETKGRWWKVGASWIGNQYRFGEGEGTKKAEGEEEDTTEKQDEEVSEHDEKLLKLASKLRMNTDRKRAIFCIIMGGDDCEDAFEKLCRSSMLQNRSERDTVRVLMECCGNEKSYNRFYGHLANRICEYQPQCKFSLQLAYWDAFKQFDTMGTRKAANLAKLLFTLVVVHQILKPLPVLRGMDISGSDMDDTQMIFLTIFMSSILDYIDDPLQAKALFAISDPNKEEQNEGVRAGLLVFCMEILKESPKNAKGSKFRKNFKAVVKELDTDGFESMF